MARTCSQWLIYTGIICLIIGFIYIGILPMMMGIEFNLVGMFTNTYSMFGYILLGPGIIIEYFKRRLNKAKISAPKNVISNDDTPILTGDNEE